VLCFGIRAGEIRAADQRFPFIGRAKSQCVRQLVQRDRIKVRDVAGWLGIVVVEKGRGSVLIEGNRAAPVGEAAGLAAMLDFAGKGVGGGVDLINLLLRESTGGVDAPGKSARPADARGRSGQTPRAGVNEDRKSA